MSIDWNAIEIEKTENLISVPAGQRADGASTASDHSDVTPDRQAEGS